MSPSDLASQPWNPHQPEGGRVDEVRSIFGAMTSKLRQWLSTPAARINGAAVAAGDEMTMHSPCL